MHNNLKQIRKIKAITQDQLARHLGVSKSAISLWENNPNERIPEDRLPVIAQFLEVAVDDIYSPELDIDRIAKEAKQKQLKNILKEIGGAKFKKNDSSILYSQITALSHDHDVKIGVKQQNEQLTPPQLLSNEQRSTIFNSIINSHDTNILNQLDSFLKYLDFLLQK